MKHFVLDSTNNVMLTASPPDGWRVPLCPPTPMPDDAAERYDMTEWAGEEAVAYRSDSPSADAVPMPLREAWGVLSQRDYDLACHASIWVNWNATTRYCPACGAQLVRHLPMGKRCPECGREHFPHLAPAVIVRVERTVDVDGVATPQMLMVHARTFRNPRMYGLVAGFVEGGETLEECVAREVREETSLTVRDVRYFGSQSWPFPSGIMVAFTAQWDSGTIRMADGELSDARWCDAGHMPDEIPLPMSIARRLTDDWLHNVAHAAHTT